MARPIYAYCNAAVDFDDAIALLAGDPERLLQDATDASVDQADTAVANLHVTIAGHDVARAVRIELGQFEPVELRRSVLAVRWRAQRGHVWFPTMDAKLEIESLATNPPLVQVTIVGSYRPPLGPLGSVVDAVAAGRVAQTTTQAFVDEVAGRLEGLVASTRSDQSPTT